MPNAAQAGQLGRRGLEPAPKEVDGQTVTDQATEKVTAGMSVSALLGVWRAQKRCAQSSRPAPEDREARQGREDREGKDILAVKVTKRAPADAPFLDG